jgi:hypothetical protein
MGEADREEQSLREAEEGREACLELAVDEAETGTATVFG